MKKYLLIMILLVSSFLLYGQFTAREVSRTGDIPDLISFQGRLTDNFGNPLSINIDMIFKIYDAETGGTAIWMEDRNVQVIDGLFQLNLGEDLPLNESYFATETRWLGVTIAADAEMTPRIRIASAPYALSILETDPTWDGDTNTTGVIGRTGNVGIGTNAPLFPLHIVGSGEEELQKIRNTEDQIVSMSFQAPYRNWLIGQNKPPDMSTNYDGFFIHDSTAGQTRIYITPTGNVGIGAIAPTHKLDIDGQIRIRGGSPGNNKVLTSNSQGVASWQEPAGITETDPTWSGDVNTTGDIGRTGSVGIGTTTPGAKLDVGNGDARIHGHTIGRGGGAQISNFAAGYVALNNNTTGGGNTAIGTDALCQNTEGSYNVAVGNNALANNTAGFNTAVGFGALYNNTTGQGNTASGYSALHYNTEGGGNTATGYWALNRNTTGFYNTATGYYSLAYNTTGQSNTATGHDALFANTTGNYNTAIGSEALKYNVEGIENSAGGYQSLKYNQTGNKNTAFGAYSLYTNNTGNFNTATGHNALQLNTTGSYNTGVGAESMLNNTSGLNNTAIGVSSLRSNTTGHSNTALGSRAMINTLTGNNNTGIGYFSLYENTTGYENTSVGNYSGDWKLNISGGTFIGYNAFSLYDDLTNIAGYGYNARPTATNQVRIGNATVGSIGGYAGWTNLSDSRYKKDIAENVKGLDFIMRLRPITYHLDVHRLASYLQEDRRRDENGNPYIAAPGDTDYRSRNEKEAIQYTGFIAQEVEAAAREAGFDFSGIDAPKNDHDLYGLRYAEFVVPLVKAVQEQQEIIQKQDERIELQQKQIEDLLQRISVLENR